MLNKNYKCRYRFWLDAAWYLATNELTFKKLSAIFGIFQMAIRIILKGLNSLLEGDMVEFVFIFIPPILLKYAWFGYMDFLIFVKWTTEYKIEQIEGIE